MPCRAIAIDWGAKLADQVDGCNLDAQFQQWHGYNRS
jgi:hypothetical protein